MPFGFWFAADVEPRELTRQGIEKGEESLIPFQ